MAGRYDCGAGGGFSSVAVATLCSGGGAGSTQVSAALFFYGSVDRASEERLCSGTSLQWRCLTRAFGGKYEMVVGVGEGLYILW